MLNSFTFPDPVTAHDEMCERLMYGDTPGVDYDWTHGTEVGLHNVTIGCKTMEYDYDLKRLWVPPSRWTMMVRQYIDPTDLNDCLLKVEERMSGPKYGGKKGRGIAVLRTKNVQGKGTGRNVRRRWGSCMLNLSFRANPIPTVSLNSRTTYFGYLALVDITVARAFAARCAEITGIAIRDIQFVWRLDLAQFHGFRSLAWALGNDEIRQDLEDNMDQRLAFSPRMADGNQPGFRKALDGYARILKSDSLGTKYGDERFSSFARIRRRFHTEVHGVAYSNIFAGGAGTGGKGAFDPLPHLWASELDFSPLNRAVYFEDLDEDDDE